MTDNHTRELSPEKQALLARRLRGESLGDSNGRAIPRRDPNALVPLSYAQERLWFMEQFAPGNPFFNIDALARLSFVLDAGALSRALSGLVARHEVLRTTFAAVGGEPVQVVGEPFPVHIPVVDLRAVALAERDAEALRLSTDEARRPFDLATGPLLRAKLLRLGITDFVFVVTMHHIVSDGWSMAIFWRELSALYEGEVLGRSPALPALSVQYGDYAAWQREWLTGERLQRQLDYWRERLAGVPQLGLPTDRPRPAVQSFRGAHHPVAVSADVTRRLEALAQQEGATLFMVLLAGFYVLLARYSGQDDVVVGSYIAGRTRSEVESLIGFFINTLVLRCDVSGDPTFRELVGRVREVALGAYAHQDIPFPKLVEELHPDRDLSRNPLFQVAFQLFNAPIGAAADGVTSPGAKPPEVERGTSVFDLVFSVWQTGPSSGLSGNVEYDTDLFDPSTIARLERHYAQLLASACEDPGRPVSKLELLDGGERRRILVEFNDTEAPWPADDSLVELFRTQVARTPNRAALLDERATTTFAELDERSDRLARVLAESGVGPGAPVAVCLHRCPAATVALLAVLKADGVYVPVDPRQPASRVAHVLSDSGARVLVAAADGAAIDAAGAVATVIRLDRAGDETDIAHTDRAARALDPMLTEQGPDGRAAYVIYTSGSTGTPKGVVVGHGVVLNRLRWMWRDFPFEDDDVGSQRTPLSFVDSIWELLGYLLAGVPSAIIADEDVADPYVFVERLRAFGVTRLWLVPSLLRALLDAVPDLGTRLPKLRFWVATGESLPSDLANRFHTAVPHATLANLYGTSEVWDASIHVARHGTGDQWRVPIGAPIANVRACVLDEHMAPVPIGVVGELYVGGAGVGRGYLNEPQLTAERFVPDPFSRGRGRLYRTGDLVRFLPDGELEYVGRRDHQVKIRGFRVELGEIESALDSHPGVAEAAVVMDSSTGAERLVARVVQDPNYEGDNTRRGTWSEDQVPQWQLVWDDTYRQDADGRDGAFATAAFVSSYTGEAIPVEEVHEWVDHAVGRILAERPRRVLEIGCGTGLLLLQVAAHCELYRGTDISGVAIERLQGELRRLAPAFDHVRVDQQPADDFAGLPEGAFDVVVLHSVVQYFPNVDYLVRVLEGAIGALAPGGVLYIGDVRSAGLLAAFHTSAEVARSPLELSSTELRERVRRRLATEKELVVDPALFVQLASEPFGHRVQRVEIRPKPGAYHNEFTRFRYDAKLYVEGVADSRRVARTIDWADTPGTLAGLRDLLVDDGVGELAVRNIPNARVASDVAAHRLLEDGDAPPTVAELCRVAADATSGAVDPDAVCELAQEIGHHADVRWAVSGEEDRFHVILSSLTAPASVPLDVAAPPAPPRPWTAYANNPLQGMFGQRLLPELRQYVSERLPEYMRPAVYQLADTLPHTVSGKVDRTRLPALKGARLERQPYVAPRTPGEELIATIWRDVLAIQELGVHDGFFELGGHSLLATQLVSRLRDTLKLEIPLRQVFEAPTIATFCALLSADPTIAPQFERATEAMQAISAMASDDVEALLLERGAGRVGARGDALWRGPSS